MSEVVLVSVDKGVATLTLNRPHVLNAMDGEMMQQLRPVTESLEHDAAVRAVVLRGAGAAFMAGGDVAVFHQHLAELPELIVRWGTEMHLAFLALRRMGKPVLASVHGAVAGAGFSLMCAADVAIAAADTRFTLAYANIGASPDGGSTHFLPRLVGYKKAMELVMLPDRFDAETARSLGLVNWVVPNDKLEEETARIARRLADGPTGAFAQAKRLMNQSFATPMETQMEEELLAFSHCARGADLREGVTAFVEKRKPVFKGA
ncbi:MAG TPA: enoyl-CoA hydratase-related protein [Burkholderiales bacterium]|jgi:2-(1,2-epoxy-1,2-dihydrophenyl)acetyl-CoA isomerase|nr:enoyl-CoA hydratase-related protein [Burkholderiales bacterium]